MRNYFAQSLYKKIKQNRKIILLSADIGNRLFDKIKKDFPKNFLNCGIAEPNMISFASGIAKEGYIPICYTITNFLIYKSIEQIRNDAAYHEINLTIVASGGGFTYGGLGMSHHATEDIGIMRSLPGIKVVAPSTAWETYQATKSLTQSRTL